MTPPMTPPMDIMDDARFLMPKFELRGEEWCTTSSESLAGSRRSRACPLKHLRVQGLLLATSASLLVTRALLLVTRAFLLVTRALLLVTRGYERSYIQRYSAIIYSGDHPLSWATCRASSPRST